MAGELRTGMFRYTVTPDDDLVIGNPLNAGVKTPKYLVFQTTQTTGYGSNPHVRCSWDADTGVWRLLFSNDGANINEFVLSNVPNVLSGTNTFNGATVFNGTITINSATTITTNASFTVSATNFLIQGLTKDRVLISHATTGLLYPTNITGAEVGTLSGIASNIQGQFNLKAPLASPALTGTPTAPTPSLSDRSTKIATTKFAGDIVDGSMASIFVYDGRSLILTDSVVSTISNPVNYRLRIYNGSLALEPYPIPGSYYAVLKSTTSTQNYKLDVRNGKLHYEICFTEGPYSFSLYDSATDKFHKMYITNAVLYTRPE